MPHSLCYKTDPSVTCTGSLSVKLRHIKRIISHTIKNKIEDLFAGYVTEELLQAQ